MDPAELLPKSTDAMFLSLPSDERWPRLKPVIVSLYMDCIDSEGKRMTYSKVARFMKDSYRFHAAESQYKRWFSKWEVRKRITSSEKDEIVTALGKRKRSKKCISDVIVQQGDSSKRVDRGQLKRYLKAKTLNNDNVQIAPGLLSSWGLPYAAWVRSFQPQVDQPSPFGSQGLTPSYICIQSPQATTPGREVSAPSPTMELVEKDRATYRSNMLLQGRFEEVLTSLARDDRIILTNFLHELYLHSFVTAKYWGRGPLTWSAEMVMALLSVQMEEQSPLSDLTLSSQPRKRLLEAPNQLCRWAIHVLKTRYDPVPDPSHDETGTSGFDIQDPGSWNAWSPGQSSERSFSQTMQESITRISFSSTPKEDVPLSMDLVSDSLQADPASLSLDAWKFAILAGNSDLIYQLRARMGIPLGIENIYPFHLASSFLDGAGSCCSVISALRRILGAAFVFQNNIDNFGHTILDSLIISVLRSHTRLSPRDVSIGFREVERFPGEEKDICGRWDTDSPSVRKLFGHGHARIPADWKHPFCHTSLQAICHNAMVIFGFPPAAPNINTLSGLFSRRCTSCGLNLKLGPLHAMLLVAIHLARDGMDGETLFGAVAFLVCLIKLGADLSLQCEISIDDMLYESDNSMCHHRAMSPTEFANAVPPSLTETWSGECQTGWKCIIQILQLAPKPHEVEVEEADESNEEESERNGDPRFLSCDGGIHDDDYVNLPCSGFKLGLVWATIQAEFLTYRRIGEGMPWISKNYSMRSLEMFLSGEDRSFDIPLVKEGMMRLPTRCGWFYGKHYCEIFPVASEVCNYHFMNMEEYSKSSFVDATRCINVWYDGGSCGSSDDGSSGFSGDELENHE